MAKRSLLTGVAYHGNRMPSHVRADMKEISKAGMDVVVHMFSHTDWDRHNKIMKDIFAITEDAGMDVWVDNWGLGGPPGDKSHFLAYYPDSHIYYSNGDMAPVNACLNSPDFRKFVKNWIDAVAEAGGKTIFWDEPFLPTKKVSDDSEQRFYGCCCPRCKKLFEEKYGHPMPEFLNEEAAEFRTETIVDYFKDITAYSASLGIHNAVCVMLGANLGINLENIGSDPYWYGKKNLSSVYEFVHNETKKNIVLADKFKKDHNIWIQTYAVPRGREEEIIEATEAAYDAGARTILAWGFNGSESNNYAAKNPERTWNFTVEAMNRIRSMERDRILAENRAKYLK